MYTKSFHIVVQQLGSLFAKTIQKSLRERVRNAVYRRKSMKKNRVNFVINPHGKDKIEQFKAFTAQGVSCPAWTTDRYRVGELGTKTIFARTLINSTGGKGIVEFDYVDQASVPRAPLYTAYIPKKAEYRVHVFNGEVIDIQQKRKKRGFENERDTRIRNLVNGYVYCRDGINPPGGIHDLAVRAVRSLGYLYGAVDIIHNEKKGQCYVLEVNSRPGLMGTTQDKYTQAIIKTFDLWRK